MRRLRPLAGFRIGEQLGFDGLDNFLKGRPGDGSGPGSGGQEADGIFARVAYSSSGSSSSSGCTWELNDGLSIGVPELGSVTWPRIDNGVTYHLWRRTCNGVESWLDVPEVAPADILPQLLDQLRERALPTPVPVFEMLDPEFGWAYVQTPLDFRAGGDSWRPVSVTASVGPVWATVTARPTGWRASSTAAAMVSGVASGASSASQSAARANRMRFRSSPIRWPISRCCNWPRPTSAVLQAGVPPTSSHGSQTRRRARPRALRGCL